MSARRHQRITGAATGLAGLLALFLPNSEAGPTVDFKAVGDVYQADQPLRDDIERHVSHQSLQKAQQFRHSTNRYSKCSQFDGRGGLLDAYS